MKKLVKKVALVLTVAAMTITGCAASVSAFDGYGNRSQLEIEQEIAGYSRFWTCMVDVANIRKGPSESSDIIGTLHYGDVFEVGSYTQNGWIGVISGGYVRGDLLENGSLDLDEEAAYDDTYYPEATSYDAYGYQPTAEVDTIAYPRVDRHLANAVRTTWCTLNTDGYYYNENGERFADNGNGTFSDVYGNILNVIG